MYRNKLTTFTFQYGSTLICSNCGGDWWLAEFTFQYGSTLMRV